MHNSHLHVIISIKLFHLSVVLRHVNSCHSSVYELVGSEKVHLRQVVGESKYIGLNWLTVFILPGKFTLKKTSRKLAHERDFHDFTTYVDAISKHIEVSETGIC